MGSVFINDSGTIVRGQLYYNENGVILSENSLDIVFNNGAEIVTMPQKQQMVLNFSPNFTFAHNSVKMCNHFIEESPVISDLNTTTNTFASGVSVTAITPQSNNQQALNTNIGIWLLGKNWNQKKITLPQPIFDGTNQATISMTLGNTSHNNDGFFWFLDNNTKWGIQGHWSPFIFRFRNSVNSGYFELPSSYGESGVKNITVTFNGRLIKVYWNGVKVAENSGINTDQGICRDIWLNGYYNHTSTFANVSIYSFRVWKTCLTDSEVATAYKFDEGYTS